MTRESDDLFQSLLSFAETERARANELHQAMLKVKHAHRDNSEGASGWGQEAVVPAVEMNHGKLAMTSSALRAPVPARGADDVDQYLVDSNPGGALSNSSLGVGFRWRVRLSAMQEGKYHECCSCGGVASQRVACKHFKGALIASRAAWRKFVKPWQDPRAWEKQNPKPWEPITSQEIVDATNELERAGKLLNLIQPDLNITQKGRPTEGKNMSKEAAERAKSFLEEMREYGNPAAACRDVLAGATAKNRGGKGTKKRCSFCTAAKRDGLGHRRTTCPWRLKSSEEAKANASFVWKDSAARASKASRTSVHDGASTGKATATNKRKAKRKRKASSDDEEDSFDSDTDDSDPDDPPLSNGKDGTGSGSGSSSEDDFEDDMPLAKRAGVSSKPTPGSSKPTPERKPPTNREAQQRQQELARRANLAKQHRRWQPEQLDTVAESEEPQSTSAEVGEGVGVEEKAAEQDVAAEAMEVVEAEGTAKEAKVEVKVEGGASPRHVQRPRRLNTFYKSGAGEALSAEQLEALAAEDELRILEWVSATAELRAVLGLPGIVDVLGDGFCWMYAVLAALGVLESPMKPTARDYALVARFLQAVQGYCRYGGAPKSVRENAESMALIEAQKPPPFARLDVGNYGGGKVWFPVLARFLDTAIVALDDTWIGGDDVRAGRVAKEMRAGNDANGRISTTTLTGAFVEYPPTARGSPRRDSPARHCSCASICSPIHVAVQVIVA